MKNKIKFIILLFFVIAEGIFLLDSFNGVLLYLDELNSEVFRFTVFLTLYAAWLLSISIGGMIRLKKRKEKFSLVKNILMLPIATVIAFGITYFVLFDFDDSYIAGIFFLVIGLILIGLMHLHKTVKKPKQTAQHLLPAFTYIKSEWNYDGAELEYCRLHNKSMEESSDEERDLIGDYAENWLLYFIAWLVKHDLFVFDYEQMAQDYKSEIISESSTSSELFSCIDNCLSLHNIPSELSFFMTQYFEYPHSDVGNYWEDYLSVIHMFGSCDYCTAFSWDIYHEIEKRIDIAYKEYAIQCECDEIVKHDIIHCDWLNADINIQTSSEVPEEYIQLCMEHFLSLSAEMKQKVCESIIENMFYGETSDEDSEIISDSHFDSITIFKPYGDEPAYSIGGEAEYEEEHGVAVMIRGEKVIDAGYRYDIEYASPWSKENTEKYNNQLHHT